MNKTEKLKEIDSISESLKENPTIYFTDISGLDSTNTSKLRRDCFESNIKLKVVKNTLLIKAIEKLDNKDFGPLVDVLKNNTAIMVTEKGNIPAKLIKAFRKSSQLEKPILKGAFVEEEIYIGNDQLNSLIEIKSREELVGDVILLLQSPMKNVVSSLNSAGSTLSGILKSLSERDENG